MQAAKESYPFNHNSDGVIPLNVMLAPQRQRTNMSFAEKTTFSSNPDRSVLTIFGHHEGSQVYEGLFPKYTLPNGKEAFFYYYAGALLGSVHRDQCSFFFV